MLYISRPAALGAIRSGRHIELLRCAMTLSTIVRWSKPELIVVATNLFEGYRLMLHAIYQASLSNAKVLLVHVIPPSHTRAEAAYGSPFFLPSPEVPTVRAKLEEQAEEFWRAGVLCEPVILRGFPGEQIPLLVHSRSADRVIVAAGNTTGVARLVGPSVAQELISALDVPVCVIGRRTRPGAAGNTPLGRILLATSFHRSDSLLVNFACAIAKLNRSPLTLLHVLDTDRMNSQQRESALRAAQRGLFALASDKAICGSQPFLLIREGEPVEVILSEAGSMPQDLVMIGSANPSTGSSLLSESITHRVVSGSQCPVIIFNPEAALETPYGIVDRETRLAHF
jgi:nucleotide-binding universal stress UspA family protein